MAVPYNRRVDRRPLSNLVCLPRFDLGLSSAGLQATAKPEMVLGLLLLMTEVIYQNFRV